jgi:glyoxylase-like metal-dependent hydrolase (beta-lactamase superfamily II)
MPACLCSFEVGSIRCTVLADGYSAYPSSYFFPGLSEDKLDLHVPSGMVTMPHTCLLIESGRHVVLVDAGGGPSFATGGALIARLQRAGIRPADVHTLILTHAHPDHIGGAVNSAGRPSFPEARHVLAEAEWDFWTGLVDLRTLRLPVSLTQNLRATAQNCLRAIRFQVDPICGETEIVPGVWAIPAPGHTPGHLAIRISSEGQHLLHLADAALHPLHLEEPDWECGFDLAPQAAAATRRALLEEAAAAEMRLMAFHLPFPSVGRLAPRPGGGWMWTPGW